MSNFLSHHHELRIPAMETLSDLTKILFHGKEEKAHHDTVHGDEPADDHHEHIVEHHHEHIVEHHHEHHKKSLSKAKRHAHAGPKRSVIAVYGIADDESEQQRSNRIGIRVDRIRSLYIREMRLTEERPLHTAAQHHIHETEQFEDSSLDEMYQSMLTESDSLDNEEIPAKIDQKDSMDDLFVTPQEPRQTPIKKSRFSVSKLRARFVEDAIDTTLSDEPSGIPETTIEDQPAPAELPRPAPVTTSIRTTFIKEHAEEHPHVASHLHHSHHSSEIHKSRKKRNGFSGDNLRKNFMDSQE